jgi:RTX calcium-binding nonapeptide repeat (4 copies)
VRKAGLALALGAGAICAIAPAAAHGGAAPKCFGKQATIVHGGGGQQIFGGPGHDVIVAGGGVDVVYSGEGNDRICAGPGSDDVHGGGGADRIAGEGGDDSFVDGGAGNDLVIGGRGNDGMMWGAEGDDEVRGGDGRDFIDGLEGDDVLAGGPGRDELYGDDGDDRLVGGPGDDRSLSGDAGEDVMRGSAGRDELFAEDGEPDRLNGGRERDRCDIDPFIPLPEPTSLDQHRSCERIGEPMLARSAGAAKRVTVGSPLNRVFVPSDADGQFDGSATYANIVLPHAGARAVVPFRGRIVRWRLLGALGGPFRLRVLRPNGTTGGVYEGAGRSRGRSSSELGLHTYRAKPRLRVRPGDLIGLDVVEDGGDDRIGVTDTDEATYAVWDPALPQGQSILWDDAIPGIELGFNATIVKARRRGG